MTHGALAQTAALLGAAGSALVILPPPRRAAIVGGRGLIAAAEVMLDSSAAAAARPRAVHVRTRRSGARGGRLAAAALGVGFVRWPTFVPVCLLAAAPFRLPVDLGSQHAFLLLPSTSCSLAQSSRSRSLLVETS